MSMAVVLAIGALGFLLDYAARRLYRLYRRFGAQRDD